jgi:xanthine dehydrogenase large subunit
MKNYDVVQHLRGESLFLDDFNLLEGTLFLSVFASPAAHGKIVKLDYEEALNLPGIKGILTYKDIPGENQIGGIVQDEELLAKESVHFIGHPIAIVVADKPSAGKKALKKIKLEIERLPVITDPREAFEKNELIIPPREFTIGSTEEAWKACDFIVEGKAESGGQEHLYLETQSSYSFPVEGGGIKTISSTQGPTAVQRGISKVLGIPMHKIEVDVLRLGGGFGGKEDQATAWAVMTALAAYIYKKPAKLVLSRQEDIRLTGKRHPYSSDYKIGLTREGKILAYEVTFYQNAGAAADLSPAILDRTLFHATNSYFIPNVKATAYSCRTNLPPNTAFRGFGGPQGMFVIESAIYKAAEKLGVPVAVLQKKNLLKENDEFPFGQKAKYCNAIKCFSSAIEKFNFDRLTSEVHAFNNANKFVKKGIAAMPICFGISFTNTMLNQASSLVHVYTDGSISVSTAAIEMGQGVNMKIRQVAASIFSISVNKVKSETTNTTRNANTSATAASSAADLNGNATELACKNILERLKRVAAKELNTEEIDSIELRNEFVHLKGEKTSITWERLISLAYTQRVNLSSHAHYATPGIHFNNKTNKGEPFAYHVYGTGLVQVKLDCLRGIYEIESVKVVHDFGKSINEIIDKGQAEGAIMQGLGWMTLEEVAHSKEGKLLSDTLSTYKVPDLHFTPKEIKVEFMENPAESLAVFNSKAIGEPPFMYGIGVFFALMNSVKAFRPGKEFKFSAPLTPEKILLMLYS